jgi:hypothetical protein
MITEDEKRPRWLRVKTPLQYLALTHRQLLVFYGSVITLGTVTRSSVLIAVPLVLAGLPQLSILLLSVVDRQALKALSEDVRNRRLRRPRRRGRKPIASGAAPDSTPECGSDTSSEIR